MHTHIIYLYYKFNCYLQINDLKSTLAFRIVYYWILFDTLRYVYKGLATGEQAPILLKLHELLLKKAGLGSIVRALTERKTV